MWLIILILIPLQNFFDRICFGITEKEFCYLRMNETHDNNDEEDEDKDDETLASDYESNKQPKLPSESRIKLNKTSNLNLPLSSFQLKKSIGNQNLKYDNNFVLKRYSNSPFVKRAKMKLSKSQKN